MGIYPSKSTYYEDTVYFKDDDVSFSVSEYQKHTRGGDDDSYSEVQWLNPSETKLYSSFMMARGDGYIAFYPYPYSIALEANEINKSWVSFSVKKLVIDSVIKGPAIPPGFEFAPINSYQKAKDIELPPICGETTYNFSNNCYENINYELAKELYDSIDVFDALLIRGLSTLIKSAMLRKHYQFHEESMYSLYISMEASYRLILRKLKLEGINNPSSKEVMNYILKAFGEEPRNERYFEQYYDSRIMSVHPESRLGVNPHAPIMADDHSHLFNDMLDVYSFIVLGENFDRTKLK